MPVTALDQKKSADGSGFSSVRARIDHWAVLAAYF